MPDYSSEYQLLKEENKSLQKIIALQKEELSKLKNINRYSESVDASINYLFNLPLNSVFILDVQGKILDLNDSGAVIVKQQKSDIIGSMIWDILPSVEEEQIKKYFDDMSDNPQLIQFESSKNNIHLDHFLTPLVGNSKELETIALIIKDITEKKKTELSVLEKETVLNSILQASNDAIMVVNNDFKVVYYNKKYEEMWNLEGDFDKSDDAFYILQQALKLIPDPDKYFKQINENFNSGITDNDIILLLDGRLLEYFATAWIIQGEQKGRIWFWRDVTERLSERLDPADIDEASQKILLESKAPFIIVNQLGKIIRWNAGSESLTGYTLEEVINTDYINLLKELETVQVATPEARLQIEKFMEDVFKNGLNSVVTFEGPFRHKDGSMKYGEQRVFSIKRKEGYWIGIFSKDITEQKQNEFKIKENRRLLESILNTSDNGILVVNRNHKIIFSNPKLNEIFDTEEILKKTDDIFQLMEEAFQQFIDPQKIKNKYIKNFNEGVTESDVIHLKDGRLVEYFVTPHTIDGAVHGRVWFFRDISKTILQTDLLKSEKSEFDNFLEEAAVPLIIIGEDRKILQLNKASEILAGYSQEEVLLMDYIEFLKMLEVREVRTEKRKKILEGLIDYALKNGMKTIRTYEGPIRHKNGELRYAEQRLFTIKREKGYWIGALSKDITERVLADNAIKSKQKLIDLILNTTNEGIVALSTDFRLLYHNDQFINLFGITQSIVEQESTELLIEGALANMIDRERVYNDIMTDIKTNETDNDILHFKDGKMLEFFASPIFYDNKVHGRIWFFRDITKTFIDVESRRGNIPDNQILLDEISVPLALIGPGRKIMQWNKASEILSGYSQQEVLYREYPDAILDLFVFDSEDEKKNQIQIIKSYLDEKLIKGSDGVGTFEGKIRTKSGDIKHIVRRSFSIQRNDQYWLAIIIRDVTDEHQAHQELENYKQHLEKLVEQRTDELEETNLKLQNEILKQKKAEVKVIKALQKERELNEMKSGFISTVSHEFRTPLTAVHTSAELLNRYGRKWPEEKYINQINNINSSVNYLTSLLDEILTYSRAETKKTQFNPAPTKIKKICTEIFSEMDLIKKENHKLLFSCNLEQEEFILDGKLLTHILKNLVSNAIKYSPEGGEIKVSVEHTEKTLRFEISDQGIGVPEELKDNLFEPFTRGKNVSTIKGSGLGLAIVLHSIKLHKGSISFLSKEKAGTTFTVEIPISN